MTDLLRYHEIAAGRQAADKAACAGQIDTGRLMHGLLDVYEDQETKDAAQEKELEKLEEVRDKLSDALKEARDALTRIKKTAAAAGEADALEHHGEIRRLTAEAIKDIGEALK
jgi:uncharacterized protein YpuA (DUF1002 family)